MRAAAAWLGGVALAGATVPNAACLGCTGVGWYEGLTVELSPDPLPEGQYHFDIVADGVPVRLSVDVRPDGTFCTECHVTETIGDGVDLDVQLDWHSLMVGYYGEHGAGGPDEVVVTVVRDNVEIASAAFEPDYQTSYPNGRFCGEAITARDQLRLE
jgi:hypothetical protein